MVLEPVELCFECERLWKKKGCIKPCMVIFGGDCRLLKVVKELRAGKRKPEPQHCMPLLARSNYLVVRSYCLLVCVERWVEPSRVTCVDQNQRNLFGSLLVLPVWTKKPCLEPKWSLVECWKTSAAVNTASPLRCQTVVTACLWSPPKEVRACVSTWTGEERSEELLLA